MPISQATAEALVAAARKRIEPVQARQVADLLSSTGRYGDDALVIVVDVMAALDIVENGAQFSDFPR